MSSTEHTTEPRARTARAPVVRAEFSYDTQDESWAWGPVVTADQENDRAGAPSVRPVHTPAAALIPEQLPDRAAVLEAMDVSIRRGTPFSFSHSVIDEAGVSHDVVLRGMPDLHEGRTRVRGVVLEVRTQGEEDLPMLTQRLSALPEGVTPDDLPWGGHETLPPGLLATLNLCLDSSAPTAMIWGEDRRLIYNQAYVAIAGQLHPELFGRPMPTTWPSAWELVGQRVDAVFSTGVPDTITDRRVPIHRVGYTQDCYFTYSYIPIRDQDGAVSGVFVPIHETTEDVLRRRRLATLHDLATEGVTDGSTEELFTRMSAVLAGNPDDIPFSLMYLIEPSERTATLRASTGVIEAAGSAAPRLRLDDSVGWPVAEAISRGTPVLVDDLESRFPGMLIGTSAADATVPTRALVSYVDLGHERLPNAINILGVGSRQSLDAEYQAFLNKVARHLHADLSAVATAKLDRERSANLQRAMQSNRQIGAAIGILMTIHKVTEQQAFLLLSKASQQSNRKLRDIADDVILAGTLPPEALAPPARKPNRRRGGDRRQEPDG